MSSRSATRRSSTVGGGLLVGRGVGKIAVLDRQAAGVVERHAVRADQLADGRDEHLAGVHGAELAAVLANAAVAGEEFGQRRRLLDLAFGVGRETALGELGAAVGVGAAGLVAVQPLAQPLGRHRRDGAEPLVAGAVREGSQVELARMGKRVRAKDDLVLVEAAVLARGLLVDDVSLLRLRIVADIDVDLIAICCRRFS